MTKIAARIKNVKDTINSACNRADRDPDEVKLVVVTKSVTIEAVKEVLNLGVTDLGENRVQQLKKISAEVSTGYKHFLHKGLSASVFNIKEHRETAIHFAC